MSFRSTWTGACVAAGFVAGGATTALGALIGGRVDASDPDGLGILLTLSLTLAGLLEGLILATGQWLALSRFEPRVDQARLIIASAAAMAFAWTLNAAFGEFFWGRFQLALVFASAISGAVVGAGLGVAQVFALRPWLRSPPRLVVRSTVGWSLGMLITPFFANAILTEASHLHWILGSALSSAAAAGMAGAITAPAIEPVSAEAS